MYCKHRCERGQSTVEYAVVLAAFLSMLLALGALWHMTKSGLVLDMARDASSHNADGGLDLGLLQDVLAY